MKKKINILIILIIILIVGVSIYFLLQHGKEKNKDYKVEKITEYKYFVSKNSQNQKFGVIDTSRKYYNT